MSVSKVFIEDGCTSCGLCEEICPEVFVLEDESTVIPGVEYGKYTSQIKDAAESCPVEVIKFEE